MVKNERHQVSCEDILVNEYSTMSGYPCKPRREKTSINISSIQSIGRSDPCILSSLGDEDSGLNEINSLGRKSVDSGVVGSQLSHVDQIDLEHFKEDSDMEGNSLQARDNHHLRKCENCEVLKRHLLCKEEELQQLKEGHQRLQQVVSEKGAELNHALRKAESNARELKRVRQKYAEMKKKEKSTKDLCEISRNNENNKEDVVKSYHKIDQPKKEDINSDFDENTTFSNIFVKSIDDES